MPLVVRVLFTLSALALLQVSRLAKQLPSPGSNLKEMSVFLNSRMHEGEEGVQEDDGQEEDGSGFLT